MSITINLLAWREERREQHTRRFYAVMLLLLVAGIALGSGISHVYQRTLGAQEQRNAYITAHIERYTHEISEAERTVLQGEQLRQQLIRFQRLLQQRTQTAQLFNDLAASLGEGVVFQHLEQRHHRLSVSAVAEDEHQITEQLRRLAEMPGFDIPVRSEMASDPQGSGRTFYFEVTLTQPSVSLADSGVSP
ncbi:Type IV pilus biogenesis protein PilN [Halomonas citrativorans]|uniref:Type IV pilus biogenesis protein PilN n=1 Tax=Halomonas citrativorans TaxID=2742612 RepID=A0A1R4HZ22_9GAMM|nr:PilN domain-containing protein [Halomonas citrativorans]SJN12393.1 Type IV pilus biogenesis protein PilN [Halomonas citrativorans]